MRGFFILYYGNIIISIAIFWLIGRYVAKEKNRDEAEGYRYFFGLLELYSFTSNKKKNRNLFRRNYFRGKQKDSRRKERMEKKMQIKIPV